MHKLVKQGQAPFYDHRQKVLILVTGSLIISDKLIINLLIRLKEVGLNKVFLTPIPEIN